MLAQRKLPLLLDGVAGLPAAAQHDLPKAVIELGQIGLNPNRSFAASAADVSHADQPGVHRSDASISRLNNRSLDEAA